MIEFIEKIRQRYNNRRVLSRLKPLVPVIRAHEQTLREKKDLSQETRMLQDRIRRGETLNDIIVPAFAAAAEAARRILKEEIYDVQILGGLVLHQGAIAEMKAGEGKTLTAVAPAYLNALTSHVHIATQNDYLTQRDFRQMGPIFDMLGVTVNHVTSTMSLPERVVAYRAAVVYVTNHELVFDYLHDRMRYPGDPKIFSRQQFAIVDEIDSILIDEARTPLIISELKTSPENALLQFAEIVELLEPNVDYIADKRLESAFFTTAAQEKIDAELKLRNLDLMNPSDIIFFLDKALKAKTLFTADKDYVVREGHVYIVDEFTGRLMRDRRYMEGVHQAIEAKERVPIGPTDKILAAMTYQSFFARYAKIAGITGTVFPENKELRELYGLSTIQIPTNKPVVRKDARTQFFFRTEDKLSRVVDIVKEAIQSGRPVLASTISVADSNDLSRTFSEHGIVHQILNADNEKRESQIVSQAGVQGSVTVATNMAGRGTDIILPVASQQAGGLAVIATKANQSRRIDNQLRGRAGRQGEPGSSQFFVSFEDGMLKNFMRNHEKRIFTRLTIKHPNGIASRRLDRMLNRVQKEVELRNYETRRLYISLNELVERQRQSLYKKRDEIFSHPHLMTELNEMIEGEIAYVVEFVTHGQVNSKWDLANLVTQLSQLLPQKVPFPELQALKTRAQLAEYLSRLSLEHYTKIAGAIDARREAELFRAILLSAIDDKWSNHLEMAQLLQDHMPIHVFAQKNPFSRYRERLETHFDLTLVDVRSQSVRNLFYFLQTGVYKDILKNIAVKA